MIRRPPRSTLFPYNDALPIFQNPRQAQETPCHRGATRGTLPPPEPQEGAAGARPAAASAARAATRTYRSEEHTSELQSQSNLVCRLLLEKKNMIHHIRPEHYR